MPTQKETKGEKKRHSLCSQGANSLKKEARKQNACIKNN